MKHTQQGFSLVEMAVVLVIVGLMLGGLLTPLSAQMEQRRIGETQRALEDAREALIGFALRNGYFPCPAVSAANGVEDRVDGRCNEGKRAGFLPWVTLGLPKLDSWNHIYRYSVTPAFADNRSPFRLTTRRDITIGTRDPAGNLIGATAIEDIPAVVFSHGRNGLGAFSDVGVAVADFSSTNLDEKTNASTAGIAFVTRFASENPALPGGEFDDMLVWVSPNILFNRMVAASKLP